MAGFAAQNDYYNGWITAHVSCYGNVHQHRLPICGRYGEPPCNENLSTTIDIDFP
jgi:hypothetical protein